MTAFLNDSIGNLKSDLQAHAPLPPTPLPPSLLNFGAMMQLEWNTDS